MNKKRFFTLFLAPAYILMLVGCDLSNMRSLTPSSSDNPSSSDTTSDSGSTNTSSNSENPFDEEVALSNSEEYLEFWNSASSLSISISMNQESADFINTYQSSTDSTYHDYYVPCNFTIVMNDKTYTYEEVGIRQKGNMSRTQMLVDNNFSLDSLAHYKLNFKETFDGDEYTNIAPLQQFKHTWSDDSLRKERKDRRLFDMEKIDIKWNRNDDQTKSKQSYALKMFRDHGVLAGNDTLAKTSIGINGKTPITTTYEVLEVIDDVFIKRHFSTERAAGDLYKCCYTDRGQANMDPNITIGDQVGVEDNTTRYHPVYDLKTNKKKNKTHTNLFNLFNVLNDTTSSASTYKANMEQVLDVKSFIMYEAIAYLAGNFDDLRNNGNNYYLYFESVTNKAFVIPYDFDRCYGAGCLGHQDYMTSFSAESTKMQCDGSWQKINLYWRTICTTTYSESGHQNVERIEECRALYQKNIEDLLNNKDISNESFTSYVNSFPSEYRGNPNGSGNDNTTFANYLTKKKAAIKSNNPQYNIK